VRPQFRFFGGLPLARVLASRLCHRIMTPIQKLFKWFVVSWLLFLLFSSVISETFCIQKSVMMRMGSEYRVDFKIL